MRFVRIAATAALLVAGFAPAVATTVDVPPDTLARAQNAYAQMQANAIDKSLLTPELAAELTDDVRTLLAHQANVVMAPKAFAASAKTDLDGVTTYVFELTSAAGSAEYVFGIDDATNKIAKLYVRAGPPA